MVRGYLYRYDKGEVKRYHVLTNYDQISRNFQNLNRTRAIVIPDNEDARDPDALLKRYRASKIYMVSPKGFGFVYCNSVVLKEIDDELAKRAFFDKFDEDILALQTKIGEIENKKKEITEAIDKVVMEEK